MKNPSRLVPVILTCCFLVVTIFIFALRNLPRDPVLMRTSVPENGELVPESSAESVVNINTASVEDLVTLPEIGEVLAQRIVDYRTENGPFQSVGQLVNVPGIGEKRLELIWDLITVK